MIDKIDAFLVLVILGAFTVAVYIVYEAVREIIEAKYRLEIAVLKELLKMRGCEDDSES